RIGTERIGGARLPGLMDGDSGDRGLVVVGLPATRRDLVARARVASLISLFETASRKPQRPYQITRS
ncbi:hypothetical protein ABTE17_21875, partial [Acinetobacter baumannii]